MSIITVFQSLIEAQSVSGSELKIQKFIEKYLLAYGLKPLWIGENLIVHIQGAYKNNALIFNAHVDTVPAGDLTQWKYDPYKATVVGDKVYGLGASDEKAAVAVLLMLAEKYAKEKPPCDIFLTFVVQEETDGSGTAQVMQWFASKYKNKYQSIAGILGEPTDLKTVEIGHKGNIFLKLTTHGDSGHGSRPEKIQQHAVFKMYQAVKIFNALGISWEKQYFDQVLGKPTIGLLTSIQAGDSKSPNKFADSCVATFDIRTTPKLHDQALSLVKRKIGSLAKVETIYKPVSYGFTDPKEDIVKIIQSETKAKVAVSEGSNDLCFFTQHGIPAAVFGPGTKSCIHKPNEYCLLSNIRKCLSYYQVIISTYENLLP